MRPPPGRADHEGMETVALVLALVLAVASATGITAVAALAYWVLRQNAPRPSQAPPGRLPHPSTLGSPRDPV